MLGQEAQGFHDLASELDAATLRGLLIDINLVVPDSTSVALTYLATHRPELLQGTKAAGKAGEGLAKSRCFSLEDLSVDNADSMSPSLPEDPRNRVSFPILDIRGENGDLRGQYKPETGSAPRTSANAVDDAPTLAKKTSRKKGSGLAFDAGGHSFVITKVKSAVCLLCNKPIKVGLLKAKGMECTVCGATVHQKCKGDLLMPICARKSELDIGNYC